ncbi:hypothetical protein [Priestia koreensis]|uniref:hypothetical protein n=1 Tax=Priestia koreensis TaxID=284581 RepID=UPI00301A21FB
MAETREIEMYGFKMKLVIGINNPLKNDYKVSGVYADYPDGPVSIKVSHNKEHAVNMVLQELLDPSIRGMIGHI